MDSCLNIRSFHDVRSQGPDAAASSSSRASDMREMETLLGSLVEADKSMKQLPLSPCTPPDDEKSCSGKRMTHLSPCTPLDDETLAGAAKSPCEAMPDERAAKSRRVESSGSSSSRPTSRPTARPSNGECKLLVDLLTVQQGTPCKVFPKEAPPSKAPGPRWLGRPDLRDKGHGKGDRRRGGARAAWFTAMHNLNRDKPGIQWSEILQSLASSHLASPERLLALLHA